MKFDNLPLKEKLLIILEDFKMDSIDKRRWIRVYDYSLNEEIKEEINSVFSEIIYEIDYLEDYLNENIKDSELK